MIPFDIRGTTIDRLAQALICVCSGSINETPSIDVIDYPTERAINVAKRTSTKDSQSKILLFWQASYIALQTLENQQPLSRLSS